MVKCTIQQRSLLSCQTVLIVHVSLNSTGENIKLKSGRYQKGWKDPLGRVVRTQDSPWGLMLCYLLTVVWLESWKFPAYSYCEQDAPLRPDIASLKCSVLWGFWRWVKCCRNTLISLWGRPLPSLGDLQRQQPAAVPSGSPPFLRQGHISLEHPQPRSEPTMAAGRAFFFLHGF